MISRRIALCLVGAVAGSANAISAPTAVVSQRGSVPVSPWGVEKSTLGTRGGADVAVESFKKSSRFEPTLDVILSKLFPAGFFWQLASMLTDADASSAKFALTTGLGEATGVLAGHVLYSLVKGGYSKSVLETALLLATGTFCSGTSWQPVVNALQSMDLPFFAVFAGTFIFCTFAFNFGLRVARNLYSENMEAVDEPTWANGKSDFHLSMTIGAATAFFVGTDSAYRSGENFLLNIVGINDGDSLIKACLLAGLSTSLGFGVAQTLFNILFPAGKCWID
mmetsp:Transcript_5906/g.12959  ORF Transcript_5906/g.12959 Transcript_5906/m.12959 type:complete len:280 (+) Transcript_5906:69-908(+)|eukprot:CAMPEP_0172551132 /NCGR_PEP_ID=MMETSP1067-20121228/36637_1 /TAXON_ID=265564 ORGANISM="Thalassiosira punctigera, Strain Tpunct2005C2" /NCGR_SAMPLE_ID=MMETSP1067 /ASSEMBLY_ACC=CAM_ASM_000444 /LENGTH=279 /DNA_ID=CAMNT_0013338873 /DNA_START=69 /DNA_END=908 /DNA_ORIENTATION=-